MRDDFSNFTLHPSSVTKCQLHQGAHEMTFQISPRIHLVWPSVSCTTPKFSCEVHARWLFKCHLTSMQDDIWKVYNGKILQIFIIWPWDIEEVTSNSKVLMQGARKMTFQISPCIHLTWLNVRLHQGACKMTFQISPYVHLAWPSVSSTAPKFSHEVHARWLFKSHIMSI